MEEPAGRHIIAAIRGLGYTLQIELNDDGTCTMWATHQVSGERHIATAEGEGYKTACLLAEMVGIDLEG